MPTALRGHEIAIRHAHAKPWACHPTGPSVRSTTRAGDAMDGLPFDPRLADASQVLTDLAMEQFYAFTLVLIRISGLMTIGPLFGQSIVPGNVRVLIVITLSLL